MDATLRIVIADDHPLTRSDIRSAVECDPRLSVCAEVSDAASAVEAAVEHRPDVCLLGAEMPGSGIAAAWEIGARLPDTAVIVLTTSDDDADLFAALRAGASGYLRKDMDPRRLPHAVCAVARGEAALPRALVARVIARFRDTAAPWRSGVDADGANRLTSREWQIVKLMDEQLTTNEIAKRLSLAPATVRSHRAHIIRKVDAARRNGRDGGDAPPERPSEEWHAAVK